MSSPYESVAAQLVVWLLSADWDRDALLVRAHRALKRRPAWLIELVEAVVAEFPTAPADRPRALTSFIATHPVFTARIDQCRREGRPLRIAHLPVTDFTAAMGPMRWPVPVIQDERELADLLRVDLEVLLWLADPQCRRRRAQVGDPLVPYQFRWLDRGSRMPRLLESPGPLLKAVQRRVLRHILAVIPVHPAAHGFVPGRSAVTHARQHTNTAWLVTADLRSFFAGIGTLRVRGVFAAAGYPDSISRLLTGLCTIPTPAGVLAQMPRAGATDPAALAARLRIPHLPQGAPTSPALSNLISYGLDRRLTGLAAAREATYTRYADDLAFSGTGRRPGEDFIRLLHRIIAGEGFEPAPEKLRSRGPGSSHRVTGIVVNQHPNLARAEHDRLRATLHDAVLRGPVAANRDGHPDFRAHLEGRLAWAEQLNPVRGARLRRQFEQISWS